MEQKQNELEISGIKCDNPSCDYSDMSVKFEDYKDWLNKPCPLCGENLLTQKCHDDLLAWIEAIEIANTYSKEELENIMASLSPEDMDKALDALNEMGLKKIGTLEDGREHWSTEK